jgi:mono/diheme cytochrome c family protein
VLTFILLLLFCGRIAAAQPSTVESPRGVIATYSQGEKRDSLVVPNLALFSQKNRAPTAFLQPGAFHAELSGFLSVDLRAQYTFRAIARGTVELLINGAPVLNFTGIGDLSAPSKPIRLNRGTNSVLVRLTSADSTDASCQILWTPKNVPTAIPIPSTALSFAATPELAKDTQIRTGLYLFTEFRCAKCHLSEKARAEVQFDAPDLDAIGSRLNTTWVADWIQNPARKRPATRMPRVFSESNSAAAARDIAAYLGTLGSAVHPSAANGDGEQLFKSLNCAACHDARNNPLDQVTEKFKPGALADYLQKPEAHYRGNPMPNFKLNPDEANSLAAFLEKNAMKPNASSTAGSAANGKVLMQNSGCLNCHKATLENHFSAPPLASIAHSGLKGCLATERSGHAPQFDLDKTQQAALAAFLAADPASSLANISPGELAVRAVEALRCAACHDKLEGLPRLETFGGKLKPDWAARFIAGEVPYKPRPWLAARMPAFPAHANTLAAGLAALHGNPPQNPSEPPDDPQLATTGAKLVSAAGGFSCVACHAVGSFSSGQVVESPGVNLAYSGERLLKSFFHRWVMNPVAIDPATKMPVYFDAQGRSQLTDILEGAGDKQVDAIWQYVRLGSKMPPPPTP